MMKSVFFVSLLLIAPSAFSQSIPGVTRLEPYKTMVIDSIPDRDLDPLLYPLFAEEQSIVALGENVHGSKQIQQMVNRLVRYAVEAKGVRTIFVEGSIAGTAELNKYLKTCKGDPARLVLDARYFPPAKESVALMEWLCNFNQEKKNLNNPVQIYGVDIAHFAEINHKWFLNQLRQEINLRDDKTRESTTFHSIISMLDQSKGKCVGYGISREDYGAERKAFRSGAKKLDETVSKECLKLLSKIENSVHVIQFNDPVQEVMVKNYTKSLIAFQQTYEISFLRGDDQFVFWRLRDKIMADNLLNLWTALGQPTSLFLAHNSHVAKRKTPFYKNPKDKYLEPAGHHIHEKIGSKYKAVGFTGHTIAGAQLKEGQLYYTEPTSTDSLDRMLHEKGYTYAWIRVDNDIDLYKRRWWVHNENSKDPHSKTRPDGVWLNPSKNYNAMVYIDRSEKDENVKTEEEVRRESTIIQWLKSQLMSDQ